MFIHGNEMKCLIFFSYPSLLTLIYLAKFHCLFCTMREDILEQEKSKVKYMEGPPKDPRIIFWRAGPLYYRLTLLGECSRDQSLSVRLLVLWEAAFSFSEFFWRPFQRVFPFHDGWFTSTPAHNTLSVQQFLIKNSMIPVPHPPYSPNLRVTFFLFPWMKKASKGKRFTNMAKQNTAEALKVIKIDEFINSFPLFWTVKIMSR